MTDGTKILMARQPIFNLDLKVVAYELLYRSEEGINPLPLISGDQASSRVIMHSYTSICEAGCLQVLPAFVNFTQTMLEADTLPPIPPQELVIEILEDSVVTPRLIQAARRLTAAGYRLALDDFIYTPDFDPLLEIADIVKVDIRVLDNSQLREQVALLQPFRVCLLAEKVETREEYAFCRELGFSLFQGYFFSKPELLKGHSPQGNKLILMQLLNALNDPATPFATLKQLIERDPALSYKLLRLVNSSAFGLRRELSSLQEALIYLGINQVKKWVSLIALAGNYGKPTELTRQILLLARMAELVAETVADVDPEQAFMAGLLVHLDALLSISRDDILDQINASDAIRGALRGDDSPLGWLLSQVERFIQGEWEGSHDPAWMAALQASYLDSLEWTLESMQLMGTRG
jgi:Predicted signal transduction protein containing EAL and modified HD-GYP domains